MVIPSLFALKMLIGKSHLKEVHSKGIHEEKYPKKGRKYTSNIRKHIDQSQIRTIDYTGCS